MWKSQQYFFAGQYGALQTRYYDNPSMAVTTDYLLLDRPIAFTLDDIEEYKNSRGFMFDNICDWLPGKEIWNMTDFIDFAGMIADELDFDRHKRQNLRDKLLKYHDGNNSQRVLDALNI